MKCDGIIDQELFQNAKLKVLMKQTDPHGFGTLKEKSIHSIMKNYYAPDEDMHEIPIENYIADIYTGTEIIEIQNGNFNKMRDKLDAFLPIYDVTIVYPIPHEKWVKWIDPDTGDVSKKHKSPKKGSGYTAFPELYKLKKYLREEHLHFRFPLLNMEEYRMLNGWSTNRKRGSTRYDRIPISFEQEICIECLEDYMQFVPYDLKEQFTCPEFSKAAHITKDLGSVVLNILTELEIVRRVGKQGRAYLYEVCGD